MSVDGSLQENLFGDNQDQDLQQVRDVMNAQEQVSELSTDDSNMCEQGQEDDDTGLMHQLRTGQQIRKFQS